MPINFKTIYLFTLIFFGLYIFFTNISNLNIKKNIIFSNPKSVEIQKKEIFKVAKNKSQTSISTNSIDNSVTNLNEETITVKIISSDNKVLLVRPEGCELDLIIKKSAIAINAADARPSRFTGGERIDCAISELVSNKRKVTLSIKLLEEIEKKEALEKYGSEGSGKNLPFSSLSEDLKKKDEGKE